MTTPRDDTAATQARPDVPVPGSVQPTPAPPPPVAEPAPVAPVPPPVVAARATRNGTGGARLVNIALGAALLVGVAGVSFAIGRVTAPTTPAGTTVSVVDGGAGEGTLPGGGLFSGDGQLPDGVGPGNGQGGRGFAFSGGMTIEGTVDAVSADSLTVKLDSGQTVTVGLDGDTSYHQQADADAADVKAGSTVILRLTGGFRPGNGDGTGAASPGTASDVTVVP